MDPKSIIAALIVLTIFFFFIAFFQIFFRAAKNKQEQQLESDTIDDESGDAGEEELIVYLVDRIQFMEDTGNKTPDQWYRYLNNLFSAINATFNMETGDYLSLPDGEQSLRNAAQAISFFQAHKELLQTT